MSSLLARIARTLTHHWKRGLAGGGGEPRISPSSAAVGMRRLMRTFRLRGLASSLRLT